MLTGSSFRGKEFVKSRHIESFVNHSRQGLHIFYFVLNCKLYDLNKLFRGLQSTQ
jgi:hypothetical protein